MKKVLAFLLVVSIAFSVLNINVPFSRIFSGEGIGKFLIYFKDTPNVIYEDNMRIFVEEEEGSGVGVWYDSTTDIYKSKINLVGRMNRQRATVVGAFGGGLLMPTGLIFNASFTATWESFWNQPILSDGQRGNYHDMLKWVSYNNYLVEHGYFSNACRAAGDDRIPIVLKPTEVSANQVEDGQSNAYGWVISENALYMLNLWDDLGLYIIQDIQRRN